MVEKSVTRTKLGNAQVPKVRKEVGAAPDEEFLSPEEGDDPTQKVVTLANLLILI
ncbi:hypothetical protein PtA15_14A427 [Puccinia triticina]|uniref:Uncharacterized protein n=1 Tax=Puccinia triticina TaxID=208348 RepID=A0ABY7D4L4_9BASI|nr:uncharacterized protein PtA15_14A427 [Puccinia triticina]WAQ91543.1 hypothetical protein PtA15_14A427 [Puccinia triticina]